MREEDTLGDDSFNDDFNDNSGYDDYLPEQRDNRWELDEQEAVGEFRKAFKDILTDGGLKEVSLWVMMALNKHKALSNLTQEEINDICWDYGRTINLMIVTKGTSWGLNNNADRLWVKNFLIELIQTHLKRAYKDGERKYRGLAYKGVGNEDKPKNEFTLGDFLPKSMKQEKREVPNVDDDTEDY